MLRNGIAASGQMIVTDISSFTIPDTVASPTAANFTNVFARFGGLAIGSGTTPALVTHTGLEAELTADGLGRRFGVRTTSEPAIDDGVYTWVTRTAGAGGRFTYASNWSAAWQHTGVGPVDLGEVTVVNHASPNTGLAASRQAFTAPWQLETNDIVRLTVTIEHDGSFTAGGGTPGGVLSNRGLLELARLMMDEATERIGYNSVPPYSIEAGDWLDEDHLGATIGVPLKFDVMAIGSSVAACTEGDTALGNELLVGDDAGAPRKSGADIIGELMAEPGIDEDFSNGPTFTNFAGDTVQWRPDVVNDAYFEVQGAGWDYGEVAILNGDATDDALLIRAIRAVTVPYDQIGDRLIPLVRLISQ